MSGLNPFKKATNTSTNNTQYPFSKDQFAAASSPSPKQPSQPKNVFSQSEQQKVKLQPKEVIQDTIQKSPQSRKEQMVVESKQQNKLKILPQKQQSPQVDAIAVENSAREVVAPIKDKLNKPDDIIKKELSEVEKRSSQKEEPSVPAPIVYHRQKQKPQEVKKQSATDVKSQPTEKHKPETYMAISKGNAQLNFPPSLPSIEQSLDEDKQISQNSEVKVVCPFFVEEEERKMKMKVFYERQVSVNKVQLGAKTWRYLRIQQQYLNQLRVLIELYNISEEELVLHGFDRPKYTELLEQKTAILQKYQFRTVKEQELEKAQIMDAINQLQAIQSLMTPMQQSFDQQFVKGLYRIPQEELILTKQKLFELSLQKRIRCQQQKLVEAKEETSKLEEKYKQMRQKKQELQERYKAVYKRQQEIYSKHEEFLKQHFLPDQKHADNIVIDNEEFRPDYKVVVVNQKDLDSKYQQLNQDKELKTAKETVEQLIAQRKQTTKELAKVRERYQQHQKQARARNLYKRLYLGNPHTTQTDSEVIRLKEELQGLKYRWRELQERKPKPKISLISQIKVSGIYE